MLGPSTIKGQRNPGGEKKKGEQKEKPGGGFILWFQLDLFLMDQWDKSSCGTGGC